MPSRISSAQVHYKKSRRLRLLTLPHMRAAPALTHHSQASSNRANQRCIGQLQPVITATLL
ncbi:hypothetical protein E2C01_011269 [Portunus trituberculatus]|uniref:Uncharacterized protein n=1 Tax=Portunus trituberculatus TaxID=210409 RepID=A0A5B7DAZ3_PORTR|nr:hypothetical protein [Portunus trituberculatus]